MREKKELNVKIGSRIKLAREAAGLTQEKFAELVSLATKNVSDIERGVVGISIGTLLRICEVLAVSSDTILFGTSGGNDVDHLAARLKNMPPEQFTITLDVVNKLFQAFALAESHRGAERHDEEKTEIKDGGESK